MSVGSCREGRVENVVDIKFEQLLRYCKNLFCLIFLNVLALERLSTLCKLVSVSLGISTVMSALS